MDILRETDFDFLGPKTTGKVRDIYDQGDRLVLITTDRHSSFDRIIAHVPWKGQVLNQVAAHWFEMTKDIVPNHVLAIPDPNVTVARKCRLVPIEAVVRGYLTGVTDTAIWTRYGKGQREFGGSSCRTACARTRNCRNRSSTPPRKRPRTTAPCRRRR